MNGDNEQLERPPLEEPSLDAAIDAVAREMTDADPSGAFRARVLAQIQAGRRRPSAAGPRWAWAGATAALMLAVASSVWFATRPAIPTQESARVAESRPAPPQASPAAQPATAPRTMVPAAATTALARSAAVPRPARPPEASRQEDAHLPPALAEIEPLRLASVEPEPLQMEDVEVSPFPAMRPIDIPNLDPDSAGATATDSKKEKSP